jgi:hypothetical protein
MNLTKNNTLREEILKRIKELDCSYAFIINDAKERGMDIAPERLSKYIKSKSGGITEDQLVWVATRLGIFINLNFGKLVFDEGKALFKITPYSELECLQRLNKIFPRKTINKKRQKRNNG